MVLSRSAASSPPHSFMLGRLTLGRSVPLEDANIVPSECSGVSLPNRRDSIAFVRHMHINATSARSFTACTLLSNLREVTEHRALQLCLVPHAWLQCRPATSVWHDVTNSNVQVWRAARLAKNTTGGQVERILLCHLDDWLPVGISINAHNYCFFLVWQFEVYAFGATHHLLDLSARWVHVLMYLVRERLIDMLVPMGMEFSSSLIFMCLLFAQSYGSAESKIISTCDVVKQAVEARLTFVVPLLDNLHHVFKISLTLRLHFAQLALYLA
mmetsp:Transcript_37278/g.57880  ORF Transcript_37278/g.57880 Transcript_37278/m.57880 type:complete len:270 (+) Transcript_37278:175-984(+)